MIAEQVSADIFGRACRLPVALWILNQGNDKFYQSEPPSSLGPHTAIRQELSRLAKAGLLTEHRPSGENRVYYERTASPLWRVFAEAGTVLSIAGDD